MTTSTQSLTAWLLDQIAADEAAARAAMIVIADDLTTHREADWWVKEEHGRVYAGHWLRVVDGGAPAGDRNFANTAALEHIARHDPAHVLAVCAAHRRIVEEHAGQVETVEWFDAPGTGRAEVCPSCRPAEPTEWDPPLGQAGIRPEGFVSSYVLAPCPTLRALASIYADRDGFREEWR
jgi:hypothetical protein